MPQHNPIRLPIDALDLTRALVGCHTRLEILLLVAEGDHDVTSIADELDLAPDAVSHHLATLRRAAFVLCRPLKKRHIYSLAARLTVTSVAGGRQLRLDGGSGLGVVLTVPDPLAGCASSQFVTAGPR